MKSELDRPLGITLLAVLDFLAALIMLTVSAVMAKGIGLNVPQSQFIGIELARRAPYLALLALLPAALGLGLWYLQNWARMITLGLMVLEVISGAYRMVTAGILAAFLYRPGFTSPALLFFMVLLRLLLSGAIAIYLLRPRVAKAFQEAW